MTASGSAIMVVFLDFGIWSVLGDTRQLGTAALIAIAAIVVGVVVRRFWPQSFQPTLFGWLAALAFVAALAYVGVASAGFVLGVVMIAGVLIAILSSGLG